MWLVDVKGIKDLRLTARPGFSEIVELEAVLNRGRGPAPLTQRIVVDLTEPQLPLETAPTVATSARFDPQPMPAPKPRTQAGLELAEVSELLRRADTLLRSGDFESARLIYSALADNGNAQAAILMAQTYDPETLKRNFVVGLSPDTAMAMHWYRRAIEMGNEGARQRLEKLAQQ